MDYEDFLNMDYEYRNFREKLHSAEVSLSVLAGMDLPEKLRKDITVILNNIKSLSTPRRSLAYKMRDARDYFLIGGRRGR